METAAATAASQNEQDATIPLGDARRVVCWRTGGGIIRRHIFQRLTAEHWNGYFSRMTFETDATSRTIDLNSAALWLYASAVADAEGYRVAGGGELCDLPNWRDRIPMAHRIQAVNLLTSVEQSAEEHLEIDPEAEIVRLDALWGEAEPGNMRKFTGLVHRFTPPSGEHMMRFSRETSRSLVVRGSTTGKTIHMIRQKVLVKFYDELVISVAGYGVSGLALTGREEIAREMDGFHKVAAASVLFSSAGEEEGEAESE